MGSTSSKVLTREAIIKLIDSKNSIDYLFEEYIEIRNAKVEASFNACLSAAYFEDSRYEERLCFDHNRVVLSEEKGVTDYINASYIDGFQQPKAYIATETPYSEKTICKFWRMIWEHNTEIIVMLNEPSDSEEGSFYWNQEEGGSFQSGELEIKTLKIQPMCSGLQLTKLVVTHKDEEPLVVNHFLFKNWRQSYISPPNGDLLELVLMVRLYSENSVKQYALGGCKSPLVIQCSDGAGRSMTFCAIDTSITEFLKTGKVNLFSIMLELQKNRFNSMYQVSHYSICYYVLDKYFRSYQLE